MTNFKTIQVIYGSLIFVVIAFLGFIFNSTSDNIFDYSDKTIFMYLVPLSFFIFTFLSNWLFQKSIKNISSRDSFFTKITKYQSSKIMLGAPLEASGLISVAAFYITSNYYYLIFVGFTILIMLYRFPSKNEFSNTVDLSMEEQEKLKNL